MSPRELVRAQPLRRTVVDDPVGHEEVDLLVAEPELLERVEGATDTGDHAVAASGR